MGFLVHAFGLFLHHFPNHGFGLSDLYLFTQDHELMCFLGNFRQGTAVVYGHLSCRVLKILYHFFVKIADHLFEPCFD